MEIKLACTHENSLSHQYLPRLSRNDDRKWPCEVCGKEIREKGYICGRCKVWLHESCASELRRLPHEIIHSLHSQHHLNLQLDGSQDFICDQCLYLSTGSRYNCFSCEFNLDLACASSANDHPLPEGEWPRFKDGRKKKILHHSYVLELIIFNYRKIKEEDYDCSWCGKRLSGVCYGRIQRDFYLHEVCSDKIPRTLYHPFHPQHPLHLHYISVSGYHCYACKVDLIFRTPYTRSYWCQSCNFRLDFYCAKLLPTLKHKCHQHPLTYFGKIGKDQRREYFRCNVCKNMPCHENFYRCVQCDFNSHLQCLQIPSSAKHIYHRHTLIFKDSFKEDDSEEYYCDLCENKRNPRHPVYYCEKCTYIVHIECILNEANISSSAPQSMDSKALLVKEMEHNEGTDINHTSQQLLPLIHEHPLRFFEVTKKLKGNRYCNGCRLVLNGPSYICTRSHDRFGYPECSKKYYYYLHEKCAKLPNEIQHPSHSSHPLNLYTTYRPHIGTIICDECRDICLGFIYLCEECNFKLDVKCANIGVSQLKEMERATELDHFNHKHKLILGYSNDPICEIRCKLCELPILGPAYLCSCCNYIIHESCLGVGLPQKIQVPFHPEHTLVIGPDHYDSKCYACPLWLDVFYYRYRCEQCHVCLHSVCANSLRRPLKYESHGHNLYYFGTNCQLLFAKYTYERWTPLFGCSKCKKICRGRPFYRCLQCAINFHLECVPIPHIVKSRCHVHPLVLKDSFVEDDSGAYYCDACEEERCQKDHVYFCEECKGLFVTHIECALAKVKGVLSYLDPHERKESAVHEIADLQSESSDCSDDD
ncbi:hypothetical protein REPUB_Repub06bG0047800 [Reevesia pubescens]